MVLLLNPLPISARCQVYTTDGRMVRSMLLDSDMSADLSTLPAGLYAVQLTTSHRQTTGSTLIRLK
ncbi:MAG: T9SS type A sorting domain-containing protein [Prevotella sp.]|nr:T9SS type A sorting domain-containing protein [Prevotella sp.]